jgi:transglutaminase-like putative cysteine protease
MEASRPVRYKVVHETTYEYSSQVSSSRQTAHLTPRVTPWQQVVSHCIDIAPRSSELSHGVDFFGNPYVNFFVEESHQVLKVRSESEVIVATMAIYQGAR